MRRKYYKRKCYSAFKDELGSLIIIAIVMLFLFKRTFNKNMIIIVILFFGILIIAYIYFKYKKRKRYLKSGIQEIDKMPGEQFEKCLMYHFQSLGYKAETTACSHDYGADLIMKRNGEKIIVQAKRYHGKVGIKAVQEAIGAVSYYRASKGFVVSNSYFTKSAWELAKTGNIELWDRNSLIHNFNIETACKEQNLKADDIKICPRCGSKLIKREGKNGAFYGCISYPKCRYTENIN